MTSSRRIEPAAEHIARVMECNPADLVEAATRLMSDVADPTAEAQQHPDAISIEAIANVLFITGRRFEELPEFENDEMANDVLLVAQIRHIRQCSGCRANLEELERFRPAEKALPH